MAGHLLLVFFVLLYLYSVDGILRLGVANACYGQGPCSRHELACDQFSRLVIVSAVHGFKRKDILCPALAVNHCNFNTKFCCKEDTIFDCTLPFKLVYLRLLYHRCSGRNSCSYYTDRVQESCSLDTRTLSSFSSITYSCVPEYDIVNITSVGSTRGNAVYALFEPSQYNDRDEEIHFSCRAEPVSSSTPVNVTVNALDVRFGNTYAGPCSKLVVSHRGEELANISCEKYGQRTFLANVYHVVTTLTPVDLHLTLTKGHAPVYAWIQIQSEDTELELRCGYLEKGWSDEVPLQPRKVLTSAGSSQAAAIGGGLAVLLMLVVTLVVVLWWKKRAKRTKYLQTIPLNSSCTKEAVERRLRSQSGCGEESMIDKEKEEESRQRTKSETLQIRTPGSAVPEPIYDRIQFNDQPKKVSAVGVYDHLRHVIVDQDKDEGYDKCEVGNTSKDKDSWAYDTTDSAEKATNEYKRNIAYDHLKSKGSGNQGLGNHYGSTAHCEDTDDSESEKEGIYEVTS